MRGERLALKSGHWQPLFLKLVSRGVSIPVAARLVGAEPREISLTRRRSERFAREYELAHLCGTASRAGHRLHPTFAARIRDAAEAAHQEPMSLLRRLIYHADRVRTQRQAGISVRQPWHCRPMSDRHREAQAT